MRSFKGPAKPLWVRRFQDFKIGTKLIISLSLLALFILSSALVSYLGSRQATLKINLTGDVRVPLAIGAARAQTNLLQMQSDVRGYLALGDVRYLESYRRYDREFLIALDRLEALLAQHDEPETRQQLQEIRAAYAQWNRWPEQLFELHDDKVDREPAYRLLATEGMRFGGQLLVDIASIIEEQGQREPSAENMFLLKDMAEFQGSMAALISALRNYVNTRNPIFKQFEYQANLIANENVWNKLKNKYDALTPVQRKLFDRVAENRATFLSYPDRLFEIVESDRYREDLYLFSVEAVPHADRMQALLAQMVDRQREQLQIELRQGQQSLVTANRLILAGGLVTLSLSLVLGYFVVGTIAGPIHRLTRAAEQVREGDLDAQAEVESQDEVGVLAETFNQMTARLGQTLLQVRREKQRADTLLDVVIPIGVELAFEQDFDRLLEKILIEAKTFCHADAGTLYLRTPDDHLEFVIMCNDTLGIALGGTTGRKIEFAPLNLYDPATGEPNHAQIAPYVALTGVSVNIPDTAQDLRFGVRSQITDYTVTSLLTIPLKNRAEQVKGVMQLLNAQDPQSGAIVPFDANLQRQMESFSLLAVAALEKYIIEQSLRQEIQQLRIEIDQVKRRQQVSEIVETDFFQDLRAKARSMRRRGQGE